VRQRPIVSTRDAAVGYWLRRRANEDTILLYAGCVSPFDARYASPLARKSAFETGLISREPVTARPGGTNQSSRSGHSDPDAVSAIPFAVTLLHVIVTASVRGGLSLLSPH